MQSMHVKQLFSRNS